MLLENDMIIFFDPSNLKAREFSNVAGYQAMTQKLKEPLYTENKLED